MFPSQLTKSDLLSWLREKSPAALEELWQGADNTRHRAVGDEVHLRGLIEISNYCSRTCLYCGIRGPNHRLPRYRMHDDEILSCAKLARESGLGTVILQSGEDEGFKADRIARIVRRIKNETKLVVALSLGERPLRDFALWREAGADRYFIRFETSDPELFQKIHPSRFSQNTDRIQLLEKLRHLGYEVGSGIMIGIPGQTFDSLGDDILLFRELDLDMIGVGPFIPHPDTSLGEENSQPGGSVQVPRTEEMVCKVLALTRLVCPDANIPSTTALSTINRESGCVSGLQRGANVVMPNLTPLKYRGLYEIYPGKAGADDTPELCTDNLQKCLTKMHRPIGKGPGARRNKSAERKCVSAKPDREPE